MIPAKVCFGLFDDVYQNDVSEYNYWMRHENDCSNKYGIPLNIELFMMMQQYEHIVFILDNFYLDFHRPGITLKEIIIAKLFFADKIIAQEKFFRIDLDAIIRTHSEFCRKFVYKFKSDLETYFGFTDEYFQYVSVIDKFYELIDEVLS